MQQRKFQVDFTIVFILFILISISLIAIYSGSGQYAQTEPFHFVKRQLFWYIFGIVLMIGMAYFDYELLERWAFLLYITGILLLVYVHFWGTSKNGSQRWIDLGFFDLQPSEFMKIFVILYLAVLLKKYGNTPLSLKASIPITLKVIVCTMIPFFLILVQPDLGSALMIMVTSFTLIVVSSISIKLILFLFVCMLAFGTFLIYFYNYYFDLFIQIFKPHQLGRIYGWINPNEYASDYGYQLKQAMLGIGSGQMTGAGFNQGTQVQSGKIPEVHTDFVFALIGEEFGFIGASILIFLYFILIYRIIMIAFYSNSLFGVYICVGIVGLIAFQVFQNIAMTIGLMPITGLALPFVSYGGSALLTNLIAIGFILSIQIRSTKNDMFSSKVI